MRSIAASCLALLTTPLASAQPGGDATVIGVVRDETGAVLPGVVVSLRGEDRAPAEAVTDESGRYALGGIAPGSGLLSFRLINFSPVSRDFVVEAGGEHVVDVTLHVSMRADVTVTGRGTFTNLADVENPAENLVGVALSASQGAVTAAQIESRPIMRAGEVLETVPGVIISQHSGEGKANQYYLRGFNLDHGTDFATTVAGVPVNMPTHGHGHGYTDLAFLIPELVSGVQYSKGPYFAELGDFSAAGAANINYANRLEQPLVRLSGGQDGWGRVLAAASPEVGRGHLLVGVELNHNDGPWERPDDYRKVNGVVRYSEGDALNGFSITGMGYGATWDAADQVPLRAIESGALGRFGVIDPTDGGDSHRYTLSADVQRAGQNAVTKVTAYAMKYDLNLFSNFTYFLDDPERGDQFEQEDDRVVAGGRASYRRLGSWAGRPVQHTIGVDLRHDRIGTVGLHHTEARRRLATIREDGVNQTSAAAYYQNEIEWRPGVRTILGLRGDLYHFDVASSIAANSGTETAGLGSPKAGLIVAPWSGVELYANAGYGFHSNDARGATIAVDPVTGDPADPVTALARATGAEVGVRTVAIPHLQSTLTLWTLGLDSELLFVGDAGTTEATRPSRRVGIEWTNYARPRPWLTFDLDFAISRARFTDDDPAGDRIPGSVQTVVSLGAAVEGIGGPFGSARLRYFGPRPLVEDDSVQSDATTLVNLQAGYELRPGVRLALDVFNLFDAEDSDIDYFYTSRLPGEPDEGIDDIHLHPTLPRTLRLGLIVDF